MAAEGASADISTYYESICYANAVKEHKNEKIGLVVKRSAAWNTLYISGIKDTSKFAGSKLQIGMVILTINGMKSPTTVKEIQKVMKETEGDLTIMAATISKEIAIVGGSNANNSPANSPVRPSKVIRTVTAEGSPEMKPTASPKQFPLGFRTEAFAPGGKDDTAVFVTPPLHHSNNKIEKSNDDSDTSAAAEPQTEGLEMTLSGHNESFRNREGEQGRSKSVSPPDSPGSSSVSDEQERQVVESGQRDSPVSICSIDHTGNIVITPKGSPKESVTDKVASAATQMPKLAVSHDDVGGREEEKKEDPSESSSSHELLQTAQLEVEPDMDTKLPASPAGATTRQISQARQQEMDDDNSKKPAGTAKSTKQRQQEADDKLAKRRGRRPQMAPGVAPGAYHVASKRPSSGSKNIRSVSPLASGPTPGAQRVSGMNSRRSEPMISPLSMGAVGAGSNSARAQRTIGDSNHSGRAQRTTGSNSARAERTMGRRNESLSPTRIPTENMPPPHPDLRQPGARRIAGPNTRRASGDSYRSQSPMSLPSKQGYVPAAASSPAGASVYSNGPVDIDDLDAEGEEILNGVGVGMGVMVNENTSLESKDSTFDNSYANNYDDDQFSSGVSIAVSEAPDMSIITSDDLVVAAEVVQEQPDIVEDRIRKQILQETAQAAVVMVEHGGNASDSSFKEEELEKHKPKNVKEKLFGGGGKGRDVSQELSVAPDRYIRKREYLPWTVQQNMTTNMWIATVVTDQKAYDEGSKTDQERSKAVFSAKTEREAHETGLAMATPYLQPFKNNPICVMCSSQFAVFNRPHNCRNCGVVVCSKCTVIWSSKRFPSTYQTSKSTHSVCLACDWSANNFQDAVLQGNLKKAVKLYESGNVNIRSPYISSKKKAGQEIMHPIHMSIIGGNVALSRWLCKERYAPVTTEVKSKGKLKSLPIGTSKGRTPLKLAIKLNNHDMLKFLVAELDVSLFEEDIKGDYRWILAHLSNTLHRAPYEYEISKKKRHPSGSSKTSSPQPSSHSRVEYSGSGSATVATNVSQNSRGQSLADSLAEV
ncbi:MAG: hypothetical protein SGBAC_008476 [Bacillariaceae sp.]